MPSLNDLFSIPEWFDDAACRGMGPSLFFSEYKDKKGRDSDANDRVRKARSVCKQCKVKSECLDYAIRYNFVDAIAGGMNDKERRRYAKQRKMDGKEDRAAGVDRRGRRVH